MTATPQTWAELVETLTPEELNGVAEHWDEKDLEKARTAPPDFIEQTWLAVQISRQHGHVFPITGTLT